MNRFLLFLITGFFLFTPGRSQTDVILNLSEVNLTIDSLTVQAENRDLPLVTGKKTPEITLCKQGDIQVKASFLLEQQNSRISSHKNNGITLTIQYECTKGNKTQKETVKRMFYQDSSRKFDEKKVFAFKEGIIIKKITISWKGKLPE